MDDKILRIPLILHFSSYQRYLPCFICAVKTSTLNLHSKECNWFSSASHPRCRWKRVIWGQKREGSRGFGLIWMKWERDLCFPLFNWGRRGPLHTALFDLSDFGPKLAPLSSRHAAFAASSGSCHFSVRKMSSSFKRHSLLIIWRQFNFINLISLCRIWQWGVEKGFISAVCWGVWLMSSMILASAAIWHPCCCNHDLFEGNRWQH